MTSSYLFYLLGISVRVILAVITPIVYNYEFTRGNTSEVKKYYLSISYTLLRTLLPLIRERLAIIFSTSITRVIIRPYL